MADLAAERGFEFGSGSGYSATWFLRGGAGSVVCAEFDEDEAERGVAFAADHGYADSVSLEAGEPLPDAAVDGETRDIGEYMRTVRSDDAVETAALPVGSGIAVSTKVR